MWCGTGTEEVFSGSLMKGLREVCGNKLRVPETKGSSSAGGRWQQKRVKDTTQVHTCVSHQVDVGGRDDLAIVAPGGRKEEAQR